MPQSLSQQALLNDEWRRLQLRKETQLKTSASVPIKRCLPILKVSLFLTALNFLVALFLPTNAWASSEECESSCVVDSTFLSNHFNPSEPGIIEGQAIRGLSAPIARHSVSDQTTLLSEQSNPSSALESPEVLIAAPQNLNPGLYVPLFDAEEFNENPIDLDNSGLPREEPLEGAEDDTSNSGLFNYLSDFSASDLDLDYQQNFDNFGGFEYGLQPTLNFENSRGDRIGLTTGVEIFDQATTLQVTNVPLEVSWHHKIGQSSIDVSAGIDFFDRLSMAPRLSAGGSTPIFKGVTLSGVIEYGPYKFNAQTLENEIRALRLGPNLFWQIAPNTTLFSLMRVGTYNDGNTEQQSFSRLEQRIGPFGVAANLFNWVYRDNKEMSSGYFSPQDFLVYSGEIFWADTLFNALDCRASASLGRQRLGGSWTSGYSYGGQCSLPITKDIVLDVDYAFSNVRDQMTGGSAFNSNALTSKLRIDF
ncbi:MAG: hypothetical protein AAGD25_18515 [Cyanobacteria bacterium P01_F01_bin.150]